MPKDKQQELKLDYIGKVHAALLEAGRAASRVLFLQFVLAAVTILLIAGGVSVDHRFSFAGIIVLAPVSLLLLGLAFGTAAAEFYDAALYSYTGHQRKVILQLYESLGFVVGRSPLEVSWSPLDYPDVSTVTTSALAQDVLTPMVWTPFQSSLESMVRTRESPRGLLARIVSALVGLLLLIIFMVVIPLVAEVLAVRYVILHQGMSWLVFFAIVAMLALNAGTWLIRWHTTLDTAQRVLQAMRETLLPTLQAAEAARTATTASQGSSESPSSSAVSQGSAGGSAHPDGGNHAGQPN